MADRVSHRHQRRNDVHSRALSRTAELVAPVPSARSARRPDARRAIGFGYDYGDPCGAPGHELAYHRAMDATRGPDWVREAAAAIRDEAVRFLVTVLQCSRHPRRFAAAWFAGESRAPNPIGYVSTALAVTAATNSGTTALLGINDDAGLWSSLASATLPYAYYALLGVLCHVVARTGATARPLSASLAIALFIGGGPGLLLTLSMYLDVLLYAALIGHAPSADILGVPRRGSFRSCWSPRWPRPGCSC